MWTRDIDRLEAGIEELYAQEAAEIQGDKEGKKGKKSFKVTKRKRDDKGKDDDKDGEGGDGDDDADAATADPFDSPFSDVSRWTAGALKASYGEPAKKKRKGF